MLRVEAKRTQPGEEPNRRFGCEAGLLTLLTGGVTVGIEFLGAEDGILSRFRRAMWPYSCAMKNRVSRGPYRRTIRGL
jgi:hypothetical protein